MIAQDQPTCFPEKVCVAVSSRQDGTMLDRTQGNRHANDIVTNRQMFCKEVDIDYRQCVYQIIRYDDENTYDAICQVDAPNMLGVSADVLYTQSKGVGLFLPIADCIGVVIYDPQRGALALAHIGRHASIANTLQKTIRYFEKRGSDVRNLLIWMAPSVKRSNYRLDYFVYKDAPEWQPFVDETADGIYLDLQGYNRTRAIEAGVQESHIYESTVNTATDRNYFSHSSGDTSGRFAVVAMLR